MTAEPFDHDGCRRAVRNERFGRWDCARCGAALAYGSGWPAFVPGLERLNKPHHGIPTYGPNNGVRVRGEAIPKRLTGRTPLSGTEFYVYCIRRDGAGTLCGTGQHLKTLAS